MSRFVYVAGRRDQVAHFARVNKVAPERLVWVRDWMSLSGTNGAKIWVIGGLCSVSMDASEAITHAQVSRKATFVEVDMDAEVQIA